MKYFLLIIFTISIPILALSLLDADESANSMVAIDKLFKKSLSTITKQSNNKNPKKILRKAIILMSVYNNPQRPLIINKRKDLAKHFLVGIAMGLRINQEISESIAEYKELTDSAKDGSGFDFNDLAHTIYGINFAKTCDKFNEAQADKFIKDINSDKFSITVFCPKNNFPHLLPGKIPLPKTIKKIRLKIKRLIESIS